MQATWDVISWIIAIPFAAALRYDFDLPAGVLRLALVAGIFASLAQVLIGLSTRLYQGRYVVGSFDEVFGVVVTSLEVGAAGTLVLIFLPPSQLPRTAFVIGTGIGILSMLGGRFLWRAARRQSALGRTGRRTLIYGAGDAGSQIVQLLLADTTSDSKPIGFLDDDLSKQHLRRSGIRVLGTRADLERILETEGVQILLVAIAGITSERLLELDRTCRAHGVLVRIIPTISEIAGGAVRLGDISDVTEADLMGRRPIHVDESAITDFVLNKRVLVTGAGGSIGSELVRQLVRYNPSALVLVDRDESALHALQMSLDGSGDLASESLVLADIRDSQRMLEIFDDLRPEIVFHAAALKHLPMLERFPSEAMKTNVIGTHNVLRAAQKAQVPVFINVSTDKAADPTSILGYSKRVTERMTAALSDREGMRFMSVRFGNVLGSRGSVIDTFRFQIANGGPVTVTDERVTRYFMTIPEAVHLVLQAAVIGDPGETLVLDMGTPVRIVDIARHMIERSGRSIDIVFTGLRQGEKLDEVLLSEGEASSRSRHPLVSHTTVPALEWPLPDVPASEDEVRQLLIDLSTRAEL